jgi:hypothetical protein
VAGGVEIEPVGPVNAADEQALEPPHAPIAPVAAQARQRRRRAAGAPSPHASKFRAATALLVSVALGALVVAVTVLANGRAAQTAGGAPWSAWRPLESGGQAVDEIAQHIAPLYRISSTVQLAVVTVVHLANPSSVVAAAQSGQSTGSGLLVAVQPNANSSQINLLSGTTVAYNLCGIGSTNCAIGVGTPSVKRLLLLRREALELALYTFKYVSDVDFVVAILPPGHTQQTSALTPKPPAGGAKTTVKPVDLAVLFARDELKPFLQQPVTATLQEEEPPTVDEMGTPLAPESGLVEQVTARGLFSERIVQAQDGSNLLMLTPLPPQ